MKRTWNADCLQVLLFCLFFAIEQVCNTFAVLPIKPLPDFLPMCSSRKSEERFFHTFGFRIHWNVFQHTPQQLQHLICHFPIAIGNPLILSPDFPLLHTVHATFIRTRRSIVLLLSHVGMCITSLHAFKCSHVI